MGSSFDNQELIKALKERKSAALPEILIFLAMGLFGTLISYGVANTFDRQDDLQKTLLQMKGVTNQLADVNRQHLESAELLRITARDLAEERARRVRVLRLINELSETDITPKVRNQIFRALTDPIDGSPQQSPEPPKPG